ncbi:unnamed protein product, partial [Oikopleura dioica]
MKPFGKGELERRLFQLIPKTPNYSLDNDRNFKTSTYEKLDDSEVDSNGVLKIEVKEEHSGSQNAINTIAKICSVAAPHGFLLVHSPEKVDDKRVQFVRLVQLAEDPIFDVSASYIIHIYKDLLWDLTIHGRKVCPELALPHFPERVSHDTAELFFSSVLDIKICPGVEVPDNICRSISTLGTAVFLDNDNNRVAVEDRFSKTVRHVDCEIVQSEGVCCPACERWTPPATPQQQPLKPKPRAVGAPISLKLAQTTQNGVSANHHHRLQAQYAHENGYLPDKKAGHDLLPKKRKHQEASVKIQVDSSHNGSPVMSQSNGVQVHQDQ